MGTRDDQGIRAAIMGAFCSVIKITDKRGIHASKGRLLARLSARVRLPVVASPEKTMSIASPPPAEEKVAPGERTGG